MEDLVVATKVMSLEDLPDECLIPILRKLPSENMDDVTMVCQRWDKVVQENIGIEIFASDVGFRIAHRFFDDLAQVEKYTISKLNSRVTDEQFPQLKDPQALLALELASPTTLTTFRTLSDQTLNLQELNFAYGSLTLEDMSLVDLDLPHLETLNILDRSFESKNTKAQGMMSSNILGFLNKDFPSIKSITLSTVATRKLTEQYGIGLLKFLQINRSSLKRVKVDIGTAIQRQPLQDYGSLDHLAVLGVEASNSLNWDQLAKIRLEELELDFGLKYFVGMEEWGRILSQQNTLAHLNFSLGKPLPLTITEPGVKLSAPSLVTIQLGLEVYRRGETAREVDCSIFQDCVNLKMLVLIGNTVYEECPVSQGIYNTRKLPKSLEGVGIENLLMVEDDIEPLFMEMPEMRKIALENVGHEGEFGMTLPLLSKILVATQLPEILVKGGINGDECEVLHYEHLVNLGLRLPLNKSTFHVTFFTHFMEYTFAGEC